MTADLAVIARDPQFGGGGGGQLRCFLDGATALDRSIDVAFDGHPGLRGPRWTWRRIEALRVLTAAHRIELADADGTWVVSTHAYDGLPAVQAGHRFSCWVGTSVQSEWRARRSGLSPLRRLTAGASIPLLRRVERRVLRAAFAVYATSPASQAELERAGGRDDVGVLPIAIDTQRFRPASDEAWLETLAQPIVLFVGRADDPRKNVAQLLRAAESLPTVQFVLAGTPPRQPAPSNVRVLGEVPDVAEVMRGATLFILPSLQEGFGIVAAEAMGCGLPVVTTPSGGPEELINASGGGLVSKSFRSSDLASAVTRILEDHDELRAMRMRARSYVEREHSRAAFRSALEAALLAA